MPTPVEPSKARVPLSQWLLVGVLGIVFIGVLVVQFGSADGSSSPAAPPPSETQPPQPPAENAAPTVSPAAPRPAAAPSERAWPEIPLAKVLQHDPFARTAAFGTEQKAEEPQANAESLAEQAAREAAAKAEEQARIKRAEEEARAKKAEREQAIAQIRKETAHAIIGAGRGYAAVVGDRTVHVGDRIHGIRIKAIGPDGITLDSNGD